jgi:tetratricopeptide (TPR) repeat protein
MAQRRISAGEYLRRYDRELADRKKLLNHIPRLSSYNASLMTTWEISFEAVAKESQNAAKLLLLCSFFHNANISFHLFKQFNLPDIPWLHELAKDLSCFEDEVEILLNFSFLQPTEGRHSGSFSIHPVVQDWGRDRLSQEAWLKTMQHSILIISTAIPSTESAEDWTCRLNLLPHAARCREFLDNCSATASESLFCLNIIGRLFLECSELKQAENMFLDAIKVYNRSFGLYEHQTLSAMTDLAVVYHSQGRFSKAKETLQTVIAASEEMDDEGYSILAAAGLNLSKIYLDEDNLSQAREALLLAMAHQDSASKNKKLGLYGSLVTLAIIFRREAKFQDGEGLLYAEMLLEQAKEGFESILGTGDLSVYRCFNNLANVYWDQGRRSDAIAAYTQALEGYEKILGPDHISTYGVLIQLCELDGKGDLIKAESLCQEALRVHERSLGPRHSSTLMCMSELGIIYQGKRELEKAEDYARRAYKGFEETMGSDHSSTVSLLANLASVYGDQQRFAEAKSLFEEALARSERAVGLDSLPTLGILANLAHVYADLKMLEQAHTLYKRVTEGYAKSLGPDHIKTVDMIGRFACFHASQGNHLEAKPRFDEAVKGYLRIYGPNHSRTIETLAQQSTTNQILDDVSKNVLEYPTSDIQYHVYCGKPEPGGISYEYDFVEKIPRILCDQNPLGRTEEQRSITGHVIQQIVSRHNDEILHSRNWSCEICGKPARELLHSALPFFVPGERASADFEPMLIDTAVPICRSAGECDRKAVDMTHTFVKSTGHQLNTNFKVCNQCGIDKGVKLCTGCRIIRQVYSITSRNETNEGPCIQILFNVLPDT